MHHEDLHTAGYPMPTYTRHATRRKSLLLRWETGKYRCRYAP